MFDILWKETCCWIYFALAYLSAYYQSRQLCKIKGKLRLCLLELLTISHGLDHPDYLQQYWQLRKQDKPQMDVFL